MAKPKKKWHLEEECGMATLYTIDNTRALSIVHNIEGVLWASEYKGGGCIYLGISPLYDTKEVLSEIARSIHDEMG